MILMGIPLHQEPKVLSFKSSASTQGLPPGLELLLFSAHKEV